MYKVLLADDESLARKNMREAIDALGMFEVDTAVDGIEVLKMIQQQKYDVVLLDIMMPQCDGLEVLKRMEEMRPSPVKVIISGYDRFEYAQKALQLGVSEYLVKPVLPEQLQALMQRVAGMLERRAELLESEKKVEEELKTSREIIRERFLERLTCSKNNSNVLDEQLEYYGIHFEWPLFSAALFSISGDSSIRDEEQQIIHELTLLNRLQEYSNSGLDIYAFHTMGDRIGVLFNYKNLRKQQEIESILDELSQLFKTYFNLQLIGGVGSVKESLGNVHRSFQEALLAFRWCIISKDDTVKYYSDIYGTDVEMPEQVDATTLLAELTAGKADSIISQVRDLFSKEYDRNVEIFPVIHQIVSACQIACRNNGVVCNREILSQAMAVLSMDYGRVQTSASDVLESLIRTTCEQIAKKNEEKGGGYIRKAKQIIEKEVEAGSTEISIGLLANSLGLSKNYFGKLFKMGTGMSLSGYVNNLRIKKAADLLRTTNMKVYEVAQAVGYENQHYFSVAFKENIGVPPSEFRDLM